MRTFYQNGWKIGTEEIGAEEDRFRANAFTMPG
jgi:hypothetical protein